MAKLILMVGLPFSGKTTKAKQLEKEYNAIRFTPDEWHINLFGQDVDDIEHDKRHDNIEKIMIELAFNLLEKGQNVILDFGFWAVEERMYFKNWAEERNIDFAICYCECSEEELKKRINKRNSNLENKYFYITIEKYKEYEKIFQKPTSEEGKILNYTK